MWLQLKNETFLLSIAACKLGCDAIITKKITLLIQSITNHRWSKYSRKRSLNHIYLTEECLRIACIVVTGKKCYIHNKHSNPFILYFALHLNSHLFFFLYFCFSSSRQWLPLWHWHKADQKHSYNISTLTNIGKYCVFGLWHVHIILLVGW